MRPKELLVKLRSHLLSYKKFSQHIAVLVVQPAYMTRRIQMNGVVLSRIKHMKLNVKIAQPQTERI